MSLVSPMPPIPGNQVPGTPLPEVIESNSDAAWDLFDAAQRARDPAPGAQPNHQPTEGAK